MCPGAMPWSWPCAPRLELEVAIQLAKANKEEFSESRREIKILLRAENDILRLEIDDLGRGLTELQKKNPGELFKLGHSTKESEEGRHSGFGLYIVDTFSQWGSGNCGVIDKGTAPGARFYIEAKCQIIE